MFAPASHDQGPTVEKQRAIRAEICSQFRQCFRGKRFTCQMIEGEQGARGIAASSAQTRPLRRAFEKPKANASTPAGGLLKCTRGSNHEVTFIHRQSRIVATHLNFPCPGDLGRKTVTQSHRRHHRNQVMKSIRTAANHGQKQIDFGRRVEGDRGHGSWVGFQSNDLAG